MAKKYAPVILHPRVSKYEPWERPKEAGKRFFGFDVHGGQTKKEYAPWLGKLFRAGPWNGTNPPHVLLEDAPGPHETWVGPTKVYYHVPSRKANPFRARELLLAIHGAGDEHFTGASTYQDEWGKNPIGIYPYEHISFADAFNVIVAAPAFERIYFPQSPDDDRPVEQLAEEWKIFFNARSFPPGYIYPDVFLWDFVDLFKKYHWWPSVTRDVLFPAARADKKLLEIFDAFRTFFTDIDQDRFSILGYSGGGQFAARFMTLYPEKRKRIALGGAGSFIFPFGNVNYPNGLRCNYSVDLESLRIWGYVYTDFWSVSALNKRFNRREPNWGDWAHDLVAKTPTDWALKFAEMMLHRVFVYAGADDFVGEPPYAQTPPGQPAFWQGVGQLEKATNYLREMEALHERLAMPGPSPQIGPFRMLLNEGVDPTGLGHDAMREAMRDWLRVNWWDYK